MNTDIPAMLPGKRRGGRVILWAGLVAGFLDIAYVFIYYHKSDPVRILQGIAFGLIGPKAVTGGLGTAALGLGLHFVIALGAAAVFYAASRAIPALARHFILSGLAYGVVVWLFMNLVVVPLSALPKRPFPPPSWEPVFVAHLLCVGLPIAFVVRRCRTAN